LRPSLKGFPRLACLAGVLLAASGFAGVGRAAAAWTTVAVWEMDEGPNATVMHDSSGANRDGQIGSVVETGVVDGARTVYEWPAGNLDVEDPQRLVTVTGNRAFNPRQDGFSVTVRFKTSAVDQNIIQKGQARTAGGSWKVDMTNGRVFCLFRGEAGQAAIGSTPGVSLADNNWHTVRCIRRSGAVTIIVDGGTPRKRVEPTGRIANDRQVTIGGKLQCNPANNVSCQYYVGRIDRAAVRRRR
jgi:hypothetical protein